MRATIWGCRGSLATPGPSTLRYGGNTSCVELRPANGGIVVLDAGTGIRGLGGSLVAEAPKHIDLLLTHLHLDHVEGLGFFAPLFVPGCRVTIWGPPQRDSSLAARIAAYLSPPHFPVRFDELPADVEFREVWRDRWELNGVTILCEPVEHPGSTLGYRLEEDGLSFAYIPDNEPGIDPQSGLALADRATVLLHDAQYTAEEYASRAGWGHTAVDHLADYLDAARPGRALMFHHAPEHADDELEAMQALAQELSGREVELAADGLEIDLTSPVASGGSSL
jgi:phosphoribosyl 1,2-cyclic phosphodiesterase